MAYFGVIFFANMGGGGGQNYFHELPFLKESLPSPSFTKLPPPLRRMPFQKSAEKSKFSPWAARKVTECLVGSFVCSVQS